MLFTIELYVCRPSFTHVGFTHCGYEKCPFWSCLPFSLIAVMEFVVAGTGTTKVSHNIEFVHKKNNIYLAAETLLETAEI